MKTVYLSDIHHPTTVSDAAFSLVEELVRQNAVCRICEKPYEEGRPEVAQNLCLFCFIEEYKDKHLSYIEASEPLENGSRQFTFIGENGYLFFSSRERQSEPRLDIAATILQWGFPLPSRVTIANRTLLLAQIGWSIYGDFRTNSVIVIECRKDHEDIAFLAYKHGDWVYLDKKKGGTRKQYLAARKQVAETKGSDGYYRYKQFESRHLYNSMIYFALADRLSETYLPMQNERS